MDWPGKFFDKTKKGLLLSLPRWTMTPQFVGERGFLPFGGQQK
jgi:hypothetical protein